MTLVYCAKYSYQSHIGMTYSMYSLKNITIDMCVLFITDKCYVARDKMSGNWQNFQPMSLTNLISNNFHSLVNILIPKL